MQLERCPFIEPRAFSPILRDTTPPWPEGRPLSLPTRPVLVLPREGLRQGASPRGGI